MSGNRTRGNWRDSGIKNAYARIARSKANSKAWRAKHARYAGALGNAKRWGKPELAPTIPAKPDDTGNV